MSVQDLQVLGAIVGVVGGLCGIISLIYIARQTRLLQREVDAILAQDKNFEEWSAKYDQAVDALAKICSAMIYTGPSSHSVAYGTVFPDEALRQRIERYLGKRKWSGSFALAALSKEQLLNPVIQQVIQDVLQTVERFKKDHSDWARQIKLLPSA